MAAHRQPMLQVLRQKVFPFLAEKGFQPNFDPELKRKGVFDFVRRTGSINHFLCVQFESDKPQFLIEIAEAPVGKTLDLGYETVIVSRCCHVPKRARLMPGRRSRFAYYRRSLLLKTTEHCREVAQEVTDYFEELEEWWRSKTFGPHLFELDLGKRLFK